MNFSGRLIAPYQPAGVAWMLEREKDAVKGGILADEMGLGKTVQTIAVMARNPLSKPTLLVMPNCVVRQWVQALYRFGGAKALVLSASDLGKNRVATEDIQSAPVVITTYSALSKAGPVCELYEVKFGRVVLDEAQYIKNKASKTHQAALRLDAGIRWCLTGTPVSKSKKDFHALLQFIGARKTSNDAELARRFVLRRTKEDIAQHVERLRLPPLHIEMISCPFKYKEEQDMYNDLKEEGQMMVRAMEMYGGGGKEQMALLEQLLRMRQCVTHPQLVLNGLYKSKKRPEAPVPQWSSGCTKVDILREQLLAQPHTDKTLIFCHWTHEMDSIQAMVEDLGRTVLRLDGSVPQAQRDIAIDTFSTSPEHNTMIIQIDCGGVGLNLHMATRVYINSFHWNGTNELQAIGRAHRTGQTQEVHVKRLAVKATVDERILAIQVKKLQTAAFILSDPRINSQLGFADLKSMFE
ncbi:hypothetical protein D9Q98_004064 [Chlorella vulgaris]|uniref:Uncharacterized protein n=1 Tax=Chlorella vulgaris TaxID=3077 RepID=A0A9D4TR68_CHLVU|nr:hypothetical protein D9Q98_004064 [Chlorella vulgaris]